MMWGMLGRRIRWVLCIFCVLGGLLIAVAQEREQSRPWQDATLSPERRAELLLAAMTQEEKFRLIRSDFGLGSDKAPRPHDALGSAGFVPAIERLGIPAQQLADAGLGVTNPGGIRHGDHATAMPSGPALAATWNRELAFAAGATMGREAWDQGFNILLAGAVNLQRDPRNGRNFEYAGEDPLLAGTIVGELIRGVQSEHVMSTAKHYALNDMETGRNAHSVKIGERAMHESDLLAFKVALEIGRPGAVMCAYNRINGIYACEHDQLLNHVLKGEWGFPGYVMSDWGAVHSASKAALAGLDQQSAGETFDQAVHFDVPLRMAVAAGVVPQARLDDMVRRILRSLFVVGAFDHPPQRRRANAEDDARGADVAQRVLEEGAVLLRNRDSLLPLSREVRSIAVIGGHADVGVIAGGGSSAVAFTATGGNAVPGLPPTGWPGPVLFHPSSPLQAIRALAPAAQVRYADGRDKTVAAKLAREAEVAIVFATQWAAESVDLPDMRLPDEQDALISAVAAANPRTAVVLETSGPVRLPWLEQVDATLQAWYPGSRGGEAIARVLFGDVNPSGRLPVSWPREESQLPRPSLPGLGFKPVQPAFEVIDYDIEGANVGYKWFAARRMKPLFAFGHGLSYTRFDYGALRVEADGPRVRASFDVHNSDDRAGADVPQVYVQLPEGRDAPLRLAGWRKLALAPGERRRVEVMLDPHMLADYAPQTHVWRIPAGRYRIMLARSAEALVESDEIVLDKAYTIAEKGHISAED
jgi:beta-glucosidase